MGSRYNLRSKANQSTPLKHNNTEENLNQFITNMQFEKKLRVCTLKLNHLKKYLDSHDLSSIPATELEIRISVLSDLRSSYDELLELIFEDGKDENDEDFKTNNESLEAFVNEVIELKSNLESTLNKLTKTDITSIKTENRSNDHVLVHYQKPKLPDLPIPSFSGKPGDWIQFKNTYVALVHDDKNLSGVVKFSYLLDRLDDETKLSLGSITLSDDGYQQAWKNLLDCFDNHRKIVEYHIDQLLNLPVVSKDNPKELRSLINTCVANITSLELCGQKLDALGEQMLINIVQKKIYVSLRKDWEEDLSVNELPKWSKFLDFLKCKCRVLESIDVPKQSQGSLTKNIPNKTSVNQKPYPKRSQSFVNTNSNPKSSSANNNSKHQPFKKGISYDLCGVCKKGNHPLYYCFEFLNLTVLDRCNKIREIGYCVNCLKTSKHNAQSCTSSHCKTCSKPHHTLLHRQLPSETQTLVTNTVASSSKNDSVGHSFYVNNNVAKTQVLLPTAIVLIKNKTGNYIECRALLDSGSQSNFVSHDFAKRLDISLFRSQTSSVTGLNENSTAITKQLNTSIKSKNGRFDESISLCVVPTIANKIPYYKIDTSLWNIPKDIVLADPLFTVPRPIDILVGSDIFFKAIGANRISLGNNLPTLHESVFGYIATGTHEVNTYNFSLVDSNVNSDGELQNLLKRFFELDHVDNKSRLSHEEELCEQHYATTTKRLENGRYIVSLPLKSSVSQLGESKRQAETRFLRLENKLDANPEFKLQYSDIINEYLTLNHMSKIDISTDSPDTKSFYMPHHAVLKPTSTSTKVRVVFDASSKSSSNVSLNEVMMVGPTVQSSSYDITLRFRQYKYVYTSDITKMYRQILIENSQRPLQRIIWRSNRNEPLDIYQLNTVTFGTASAPYLATKTVNQLAIDEKENFPQASAVASRDFYVDDCLSGSDNIDDAIETVRQLREMFSSAGFELTKWCANDKRILDTIPQEKCEILKSTDVSSVECIKTLGIMWQPLTDKFIFVVPSLETGSQITKRSILSQIAKLYDPLGFLSPVIITAKIILQSMWKSKADWDDPAPQQILNDWNNYQSSFSLLNNISIDRKILCDSPQIIELHGFADASESAYGACFYLRSIDHANNISVKLICSKTKVAPIKTCSLPRLELCSAWLLSKLLKILTSALQIRFDNIFLWSDSTITLAWIRTEPYKLKQFIANRVTEIQDLTPNCVWNHVTSENNPADIIWRGIMPNDLTSYHEWFHGPNFLYSYSDFSSPDFSFAKNLEFDPKLFELRPTTNLLAIEDKNDCILEQLINKFSSYVKLLRVTAYCHRYLHNIRAKNRGLELRLGPLSVDELNYALNKIVIFVQRSAFPTEIKHLTNGKPLPPKSSILSLNPFVDKDGVLRVGGRIDNSTFEYDVKHPILLPAKCHFTTIVFRHYHLKYLHAGPQTLVSFIRQKFWPISAKNVAKQIVRKCIPCFRNKPQIQSQLMGELPSERFTPARPFYTTGIDYCGPFTIIEGTGKKATYKKVYVAVFVCFVTKCVTLDIVTSLTSEEFINCLKRFISRRGKPHTIVSDNATTFVGAQRELRELFQFLKNDLNSNEIINFCALEEIAWKFIPPRSPNFGGLWESFVKLFKYHLKRASLNHFFRIWEFHTIITQIEGILNSRPLTTLSSDPNDPLPLTPAHFLCGGPILFLPEPSLFHLKENQLSNWQKVTKVVQTVWNRFSTEYLHTLQQRQKWKSSLPNINLDDVVLLVDENLPCTQWPMGIVETVHEGSGGKIRVVSVKTKSGTYKRAISKICKLPID